jgi:hypothetical protein
MKIHEITDSALFVATSSLTAVDALVAAKSERCERASSQCERAITLVTVTAETVVWCVCRRTTYLTARIL